MAFLDQLHLFGRQLPMEYQTENAECGLACVSMIASYHGYRTDLARLRSKYKVSLRGVTAQYIAKVASRVNMDCTAARVEIGSLGQVNLPAIMHWDLHHFVVLRDVRRSGVVVHDPRLGIKSYGWEELSLHFTGVILELRPNLQFEPRDDRQKLNLRRIMGRVTGLKRSLVQAAILAAALEVFTILLPVTTQLIIDDALVTSDIDLLYLVVMAMVALGLLRAAVTLVRNKVLLHLGASMGVQWVANVIQHMLKLPDSYYQRRHLGDTMSRFASITSIQQTLTTSVLSALLDGVMTVVTLTMLYIYSAKLATIALLAVLVYAALRWFRFETLRAASEGQLQRQARQQSKFIEIIRGVRAIKMFNSQEASKGRYLKLVIDSTNANVVIQQLNFDFQLFNSLIVVVEGALILGIGAHDVMTGAGLSIGMLMAILSYKDQFTSRVTSLVDKGIEFRMLRIPLDRLADIVLTPPEEDLTVVGLEQKVEPSIELIDVGFKYGDSDKWVLRHVDLRIAAGESVVLVGPSGCGKTTLLNLMLHTLKPTEGEILIGGKPMSQIGLSHYRGMFGAVLQDDRVFTGSIADNIAFWSGTIDMDRVHECAKLAQLHADIEEMPMGYETLIDEANAALSGGQKQRLFIARALYKRPEILFLDEATSHLDAALDSRISETVGALKMTRVVIAHRAETIRASGRPIFVNADKWLPKGAVLAQNPAAGVVVQLREELQS